jgi:TPR repeat protein
VVVRVGAESGRDSARAEEWWEQAAAAGNAGSMNALGALLHERDPAKAQEWYERAAEAGYAPR